MKYSPFEQEEALKNMVILVDTREQPTASFQRRVEKFPKWRRQKLDAGDYSCELNVGGELIRLPVAIERKMGLDELCQCFTGGRKRFQREFERAKEQGIKLYLLVENADWEKIYSGEYRSLMKPDSLIGSMLAWSIRYGVQFFFCKPSTTASMIRKILHYEAKEWLEHDEQPIRGNPPESQSG